MNKHGSTLQHQNLVKEFMIAVSAQFPNSIVLTYTNGMFRAFDNPERIIRAGLKGVLDVLVLLKGQYLWFDAKTGKARFTKEQRAFRDRLTEINGEVVCFKLHDLKESLEVISGFYKE